ncbi:MAG: bifunctional DNA-formamidopyrimidine glycosylase/DNA-(apurinic or apyrimidinic site) lyase [Gammaproteobacteria bacterium]|nr:bifunctional DNA-formamidopyrimidine glycosylase/DNA-(apurinic or apyrimidinic site) lyase [Gammaproteobacteria bacterium]
MPELPEVETTRRGIEPHLLGHSFTGAVVRQRQLRWPVPARLNSLIKNKTIKSVDRRGKYIIIRLEDGALLLHLGMSGSLRVIEQDAQAQKHDHVDLLIDNNKCIRLHDPRRFGSIHWIKGDPEQHKLLCDLGPEPLEENFKPELLFSRSRKRKLAVKLFIMDSKTVVGVGNIYASEALFKAGIRPGKAAGRVSRAEYEKLYLAIKQILTQAIKAGGTTLQDFTNSEGKPGYFKQELSVYGRADEPCLICNSKIKQITMGQRSTFYCPQCQK